MKSRRKPTERQKKEPEKPKHFSHKDTKSWCGGKAGREHIPYWESKSYFWTDDDRHNKHEQMVCMVCGKTLKYTYSKWPGGREPSGS